MAKAVVTLKIMPESPEVDLSKIEEEAKKIIAGFVGEGDTKTEVVPVAFGLKAVNILFVMDESKGSPDPIAEKVSTIEGVNSAEITDVRRAIG